MMDSTRLLSAGEEKKEGAACAIPAAEVFEKLPLGDPAFVGSVYPPQVMSPMNLGTRMLPGNSPLKCCGAIQFVPAVTTPVAATANLPGKLVASPVNCPPGFGDYMNMSFASFANVTPCNNNVHGGAGGFSSYNPLFGSGSTSPCFAANFAQMQGLTSDNVLSKSAEDKDN